MKRYSHPYPTKGTTSGNCRLPYGATFDPPNLGLGPDAVPAREIPARSYRKTMPGWMPTSKADAGILRVESILEMDGLALFEADSRFVQLATQPHKLQYWMSDGPTIKSARYFPDLIAKRCDGEIIVVDFKTDADAASTRWAKKSEIVRKIYDAANVIFETLPKSVVRREPRHSNVKFLLRHRPSGKSIDLAAEAAIWRVMEGKPDLTAALGDIIGQDGLEPHSSAESSLLTTFAQLVLRGHLMIDLNRPISMETRVILANAANGSDAENIK